MSVYHYRGAEEETVPSVVQAVIVDPSVLELPWYFRNQLHPGVKEVILHEGLESIREYAFRKCRMQKVTIYTTTTRAIRNGAFEFAKCLMTVEFVSSPSNDASSDDVPSDAASSCEGLTVIEEEAFSDCSSLQRIKIPPTVEMMGKHVFSDCTSLVEVNLSRSSVKMISPGSFDRCVSLQAIWMPHTLECIGAFAFRNCSSLVTVKLPQFRESLVIQMRAFIDCSSLANIELPKNHSSGGTAFEGCTLLEDFLDEELEDFEEDEDENDNEDDSISCHIATGLVNRFLLYPIHKLCYHSVTTRAVDFLLAVNQQNPSEMLATDTFSMTPFHVLCSSVEPRQDLFEILLEKYPCQMLRWKDENGKEAMDYLIANWTPKTAALLEMSAQGWMLDPLNQWGIKSRKLDMERQMQDIMTATTKENRSILWYNICDTFELYAKLESVSILEMALWRQQIKSGWNADHTKKIHLDRYQCLNQSRSGVVLPGVGAFLGLELVHLYPSRTDRRWKVL
ncbi:MAG: hypothetical protein SGBAC_004922 [Bacillariaceae sp.]